MFSKENHKPGSKLYFMRNFGSKHGFLFDNYSGASSSASAFVNCYCLHSVFFFLKTENNVKNIFFPSIPIRIVQNNRRFV